MADTVVRAKVTDIMASARPVYPEPYDWATTIEYLQSDPVEREILSELLTILGSGDSFRLPIRISDGVFDDRENEDTPCVSDGTHRFAAHIIHGSEYVDVIYQNSFTEDDEPEEYYGKYQLISTSITYPEGAFTTEEEEWEIHSILRSFKISDDIWVTSDISSSKGLTHDFTWHLEEADEELMSAISAACVERVERYLGVTPASINTYVDVWNEEEIA